MLPSSSGQGPNLCDTEDLVMETNLTGINLYICDVYIIKILVPSSYIGTSSLCMLYIHIIKIYNTYMC